MSAGRLIIGFSCVLLLAFSNPISNSRNTEQLELVVGEPIKLCCPFKSSSGKALNVVQNQTQIYTVKNDGMILSFNNGWKNYYKDSTFCMEKIVEKHQENIQVDCHTRDNEGLGPVISTLSFDARVVHRPQIKDFIVVTNKTHVNIKCVASGSPNLEVSIFRDGGQEIVRKSTDANTLSLLYSTENLYSNPKFQCFAKSSFVNVFEATNTTSSYYAPILEYYEPSLNTLIGINQVVSIKVKANPQPIIKCTNNLTFVKETQEENIFKYSVHLNPVEKKDLREYSCLLTNAYGEERFVVSLDLKPTSAKKTSDDVSVFDDYYQLTWSTESKSRLVNFTVLIQEKTDRGASKVHSETIKINSDDQIESNLASLDKRSDIYTISYHVKDLKPAKPYIAAITDCNEFGCQMSSVGFETGSSGNMIQKDYFSRPPVIAAAIMQGSSSSSPAQLTWSLLTPSIILALVIQQF